MKGMHDAPSPDSATTAQTRRRTLRFLWVGLVLSIVVAGMIRAVLNPSIIVNAIAPRSGIEMRTSIPYGDGARRMLDVYAPANARDAPVIVFFYGGSWQRGSKDAYRFVAADLARRGFVAIVPDYTVYPDGKFPQFLEDGAQAVAWARGNARSFGGNADALLLMGHSAGAHIAAMLSFEARWLRAHGMEPRRDVAGVIGLAGPYDFLPIKDPIVRKIMAAEDLASTQPITFVAGGEPPVWLGVAEKDTTVRPGNSERLAQRLLEHGGDVTLVSYPRPGHISLIGAFSPLLRVLGPVADDIAAFVQRVGAARTARLVARPHS